MASFTPAKILIFGGTGVIGRYITASLLRAKPAFSQVVLFTSANSAAGKASLLDKWKAENRPLETAVTVHPPATLTLRGRPEIFVD